MPTVLHNVVHLVSSVRRSARCSPHISLIACIVIASLLGACVQSPQQPENSATVAEITSEETREAQPSAPQEAESTITTKTENKSPAEPPKPRVNDSCDAYKTHKVKSTLVGQASYYADSLAGNSTASGESYDPTLYTAAHKKLKFGTILRVSNKKNKKVVCVKVNDRGPFGKSKRIIDLSREAAEALDMIRSGVIDIKAEVIFVP